MAAKSKVRDHLGQSAGNSQISRHAEKNLRKPLATSFRILALLNDGLNTHKPKQKYEDKKSN
jgi:hypothetical protein